MSDNSERAFGPNITLIPEECEVEIRQLDGPGTERTIQLTAVQLMDLGRGPLLGVDPMQYVSDGGEQIWFLSCCIMAGSTPRARKKMSTKGLAAKFHKTRDILSWDDLQQAFLYCIAYAKGEPDRTDAIAKLDLWFDNHRESGSPLESSTSASGSGSPSSEPAAS